MKRLLLIFVWVAVLIPQGPAQAKDQRWIAIPALDISQQIVTVEYDGYQWDTSTLEDEIGHLQYLDWLNGSNTVLVGHNPGAFSQLDQIKAGDIIYIYDGAEVYKFAVTQVYMVDETALYVYFSTETQRLTLFTCYGRLVDNRYLDRFVVIADPSP